MLIVSFDIDCILRIKKKNKKKKILGNVINPHSSKYQHRFIGDRSDYGTFKSS
jgi:hypothetical protein